MATISDPTAALKVITTAATTRTNYRVSYQWSNPGPYNGLGCSPEDALTILARATSCTSVSAYSEYGHWAVPGILPSTGESVTVLVTIQDYPVPNSLLLNGLGNPETGARR
jgi:hypothetical protein